ncbi:hypothetical protein [Oligella urethralis]|uniref:Uncharacterized protein n=1 Tax=Oligella urethralis TaxID=90245 RepID=A0A2X1ULT7_9BURK|nr:hypothetical protein [Oligella urethralis]SPY08067.1 Uncharacterised protein [Oligella urethralis]
MVKSEKELDSTLLLCSVIENLSFNNDYQKNIFIYNFLFDNTDLDLSSFGFLLKEDDLNDVDELDEDEEGVEEESVTNDSLEDIKSIYSKLAEKYLQELNETKKTLNPKKEEHWWELDPFLPVKFRFYGGRK